MCSLYMSSESENRTAVEAYERSSTSTGKVNKGVLPAWLVQWQGAEDW